MLKGKVVIISGAGAGLGKALAIAFCNQGAKVVGLGRSMEKLKETGNSLEPNSFFPHEVDVTNHQQVNSIINNTAKDLGRIDFLFNNAAVYPKVNFLDEAIEQWNTAINTNINAVANLCKCVLPHMIQQKTGRIYNLGSWADLSPIENSAAYSASKGAIHALTKAIAKDISHLNLDIGVHEWIPGSMNTAMGIPDGLDPALSASWGVAMSQRDNNKKNCIFVRDHEWLPPKSLKQRLKDKLLFWR